MGDAYLALLDVQLKADIFVRIPVVHLGALVTIVEEKSREMEGNTMMPLSLLDRNAKARFEMREMLGRSVCPVVAVVVHCGICSSRADGG